MTVTDKIANIIRAGRRNLGSAGGMAEEIVAALPDMTPDLVWDDLHGDGSLYQTSRSHPFHYHAVINYRGRLGWSYLGVMHGTLKEAQATANTDYKSALAKAMGWTA